MLPHHTMFNTLYSPLVRVGQGIRLVCSHHTLFRPSLQACISRRRKIYISICHPHIPSFIIDAPWNLNHLIGLISRVSFTLSGQYLLCSDRQTVSPTYRRKGKHVITETFLLRNFKRPNNSPTLPCVLLLRFNRNSYIVLIFRMTGWRCFALLYILVSWLLLYLRKVTLCFS